MKNILLAIIAMTLVGCAAAKLDTGMGSTLTIEKYGVNGATVRYGNQYSPGAYVYYVYTWEQLKQEYPMLSKELDELQRKALKEKK
jgi:hypothetical protein